MIEKDFAFFEKNKDVFIKEHKDEYVVIKDEKVVDFFKTNEEAFSHMKNQKLGTFIVQKCVSDVENTAMYYSNRVEFLSA